ncbi:MAG: twin-arginine translocase TatA/TatE family subunit [Gammaproteobacteria bacterium AqS3]|nr:twin-arginine translocase TatA/TatE family subunit [Gammaproteobacteria bacterium AqS3]
MGFGGISIWQLLIVLAIVLLLFGSKRIRSIGSDLGAALRSFRKSSEEEESSDSRRSDSDDDPGSQPPKAPGSGG